MNAWTYYNPNTGEIVAVYNGFCIDRMDEIYPDLARIPGEYTGALYQVVNGEAVLK